MIASLGSDPTWLTIRTFDWLNTLTRGFTSQVGEICALILQSDFVILPQR
jgi:hypothetical protein